MSTECLSAYFRRRILLPRVFILWALLVFAAEAGSDRTLQAFLLLSLIVQFRVLDDYADRGHDAAVNPRRSTCDGWRLPLPPPSRPSPGCKETPPHCSATCCYWVR